MGGNLKELTVCACARACGWAGLGRLMELNPKAEHKEQALKVLKVCDANRSNEVELQYDERNPFVICT